jgi:hypothetical protein
MPVLKRRSRIVSFRLSDEEYAAMMESCISRGSRSLSDYARAAACHHFNGGDSPGGDGEQQQSFLELKSRVEELDRMVRRLTQEAGSPAPPPGPARRKGNGDLR